MINGIAYGGRDRVALRGVTGLPLAQPAVLTSRDGVLEVQLTAAPGVQLADHPVSTFWYHPHLHGHAADQVFGGLVGALLVGEGPELAVTSCSSRPATVTNAECESTFVRSKSRIQASPIDPSLNDG